MIKLKEITLIVLDESENFNSEDTQLRLARELWKDLKLIQNRQEFDKIYENLEPDEKFVLACHVFHTAGEGKGPLRGYLNLDRTGIEQEFKISANLISSADSGEVMKTLNTNEDVQRPVLKLTKLRKEIEAGHIAYHTKSKIQSVVDSSLETSFDKKLNTYRNLGVDYGIITAMYKDEFEQLTTYFNWTEDFETGTKQYKIGNLKSNPQKKVVAAIPSATGMVDSAIIATQMCDFFRPKYLLMSGVCGGHADLKFGDIVVAKNIFVFQKGKISDVRDKKGNKIELFDKKQNLIDYDQLYDNDGKRIILSIEKFEREHDTIIEIDKLLKDKIEPKIEIIKDLINKELKAFDKSIDIHFEPMACSTMVINKEGFFESEIKVVDRKTAAVEMESYGVARATEYANDGKTKFVIFKSVMDNTKQKDDKAKIFAARTSAMFLNHLMNDVI